jgi:serine/threonine-protein kinase
VIGTTLNGRFTVEKELGRGGMGAVYRATDQILQRNVAIKVLKDIRAEDVGLRIRLEAQILARLVHENIVRLYDLSFDGSTYYFIMEEVEGPSLRKRWNRLDLLGRVRILARVAEALDYAHRQGVIHRDAKPANVLLTGADWPKLSDFGLSILADQSHESGVARGTPTYMSPEQAQGRRLDHRTDLYSLGVMLYEAATGLPPFQGATIAIMSQHVGVAPERPRSRAPGISTDLETLILSLLAKSPDARPGSGKEVADRLDELVRADRLFGAVGSDATTATLLPAPSLGGTGAVSASRNGSASVSGGIPAQAASTSGRDRPLVPSDASGGSLVEAMVAAVTAEPIPLVADERYLCGHYLAYLLGGSRRRGFLLRRPLDPLNADRARLLLALAALGLPEGSGVTLEMAADLLEGRHECRPALTPVVVMKYLAGRDSAGKRKRFRQLRSQLQQASEYAARHMTDDNGILNPGLMPQSLDDLRRVAPKRHELDDQLVHRWNQVGEVWRHNAPFRDAVLRYATTRAWRDPASRDLWPEVVYPLIERARRQRRLRSGAEAFWDACGQVLHVGDAGPRMDRAFVRAVPKPVIDEVDIALDDVVDELQVEEPMFEDGPSTPPSPVASFEQISPNSFRDIHDDEPDRLLIRLAGPGPVRLTLGELRELWREAVNALRGGGPAARAGHRHVPIGPYRLTVVATIRAKSAGQVAIQGMTNKQVELLVPSFTGGGANSRPVLAAYPYQNHSLLITHLDHLNQQRFTLWDASIGRQTNFADASELNHALFQLGLEVPDSLGDVLSKRYQPRNAV